MSTYIQTNVCVRVYRGICILAHKHVRACVYVSRLHFPHPYSSSLLLLLILLSLLAPPPPPPPTPPPTPPPSHHSCARIEGHRPLPGHHRAHRLERHTRPSMESICGSDTVSHCAHGVPAATRTLHQQGMASSKY